MLSAHDSETDKNVIKMPSRYRGIKNAEDAMTVIRNAIYEHGDAELLANRIGVSVSCIFAIRAGRTKWPRSHTFFGLLAVLDLEMIIRRREDK